MESINIYFRNKEGKKNIKIITTKNSIDIIVNIYKLTNCEIGSTITSVGKIISIYKDINLIQISFDTMIKIDNVNMVLTKLHDELYTTFPITGKRNIKLVNMSNESQNIMNTLSEYKNIVMDSNKTPDTYLNYIKTNIPANYEAKIFDINKDNNMKLFPFSYSVGKGSHHGSYFVHILPKNIDKTKTDLFLIGKAVTYDSGGLNLKNHTMCEMYCDMIGSAIVFNTIVLLDKNNSNTKYNIHGLFPIVENMICNSALRPGSTIQSPSGKTVEVDNTDAEGRLCIADAIEYANKYIESNLLTKCMIIDVATLTGNATIITGCISSIIMGNKLAKESINKMIDIGEKTAEYLDYLHLRDEMECLLSSNIADIKNSGENRSDCILGGMFIKYFTNNNIPWIHIDVAPSTFTAVAKSYGINLLYEFIKQ